LIRGHKIDFILDANNYEEIDEEHLIVEQIETAEKALQILREGTVMSKGTTTSTGRCRLRLSEKTCFCQ
jgi:hypothetical protein